MHRYGARFFLLAVLSAALATHVGAVPAWVANPHPGSVSTTWDSDCGTPSDCLASDDGNFLYARDHHVHGSDPIKASVQDPVPGGAVLHEIRVTAKLRADDSGYATVSVWNGGSYQPVARVNGDDEVWRNRTVTDIIAQDNGEYPLKVNGTLTDITGDTTPAVDYLRLEFIYTKVGSLSYSTANGDDAPELGSGTIAEGEQTDVSSTTVCSGGYCGQVDSLLRANGSAVGDTAGISLADGDNPQTAELCDGNPDMGSCSTAELPTDWTVQGDDAGAYSLDVKSASDYSDNGVNEPDSSDSLLHVSGGTLTSSIAVEKTTVVEGGSLDVTGTVTCDAGGGCADVTITVEDGDGTDFGSGTTPFATSESNPKSCGDLSEGGSCTKTWTLEATGEGTNDHTVQVRGASADGDIGDTTSGTTVTIEAPSVSISGVSAAGSSSSLDAAFDYSANVDAAVTCTLNGGPSCSTGVTATDGSTDSGQCTIGAAEYSSDNSLECDITNSTHGVSDTATGSFAVTGSLSGADTGTDTVNPGDAITVYCAIGNTGDIRYDGGKTSQGYSALTVRLEGPDGQTAEQTSTDPTLSLDAGSSTTESEQMTVPESGSAGEWSAVCADYGLIDSILLASGPRASTFTVSEETSEGLDVSILSPNPRKTHYTGQTIDAVVDVDDADGNDVTGASVTANGNTLRDDGSGADEQANDGLYSRALIIPETENNYRVQAQAEKGNRTGSTSTILTVQDGFTIDSIRVKESYKIGETVRVNGSLALHRASRNTTVDVAFVDPSGTVVATRTDTTLTDAAFAASYTLDSGASTGVWTARVRAEDDYDADSQTQQFEVNPPNPGAFYLNFLSPDRSRYQPGDAIKLELRPASSRTGNTVSLQSVRCRVTGRETTLQSSGSVYAGTLALPMNVTPGSYTVTCTGRRRFEGALKTSKNSFSIDVAPIPLDVEVLEPAGGVVQPGANTTLTVNVTRRGTPVENASFTLLLDGENASVTLRATDRPGVYTSELSVPSGAESLRLRAADANQNTGRSSPIAVSPGAGFNMRLFALYAGILAIVSLALYGIYRKYLWEPPLERQQEELQRKLRSINESIEDTQRNYFNRKIDRETFRTLMEKYEKEKTQVENELDEVNMDLERGEDDG